MKRVCLSEKNKLAGLRTAIGILTASWLLLPHTTQAAPPSSDAACDAAIVFVSETQTLNFGRLIPNGGGTVSVDHTGARSVSVGAVILLTSTVSQGLLVFDTPGENCSNKSPTVTFTAGTLNGDSGGTMTVNNLYYSSQNPQNQSQFRTGNFYIGGDLVVGATQQSGSYTGTYGIMVQFP